MTHTKEGIGLFGLIGLVVSSCIGTGIFALTGSLAEVATPGGVLISWLVVGIGFLCLALSLNHLVIARPEDSSIYAYATDGFGPFAGFLSGWGYWLSAWLGNVAFATILASTLGFFIQYFLPGNNLGSIALGSLVNWVLVAVIIFGVEQASFVNALIMLVKVAALGLFVVFGIALFKADVISSSFWGNVAENLASAQTLSLGEQIQNCIISMMWVFIGVEGASVVASRAHKREQAGIATILGLAMVLIIYILATMLPYGYMSYTEVASLNSPAMLYVFEDMMPGWGGAFICIAILISGFGCWLSFTLLPAEITKDMANDQLLGSFWAKLNARRAPTNSLIAVGVCTQLFMLSLLYTEDAYTFAYSMCAVAIAITWALAAAFELKVGICEKNIASIVRGGIATIFLVVGTALGGWSYLLMCCVGYVPGIIFYVQGRKEAHKPIFTGPDYAIVAVVVLAAALALYFLVTGAITL